MAFPRLSDNGGKQSAFLKWAISLAREAGSWADVVRLGAGILEIGSRYVALAARDVRALVADIDRDADPTTTRPAPAPAPTLEG